MFVSATNFGQTARGGIIILPRVMRLVFGVRPAQTCPYTMPQISLSHTISREHSRPGHMPLWQTHTCHPSTPVRGTAGLDPSLKGCNQSLNQSFGSEATDACHLRACRGCARVHPRGCGGILCRIRAIPPQEAWSVPPGEAARSVKRSTEARQPTGISRSAVEGIGGDPAVCPCRRAAELLRVGEAVVPHLSRGVSER